MSLTIPWNLYGSIVALALGLVVIGMGVRYWPMLQTVWQRVRGSTPDTSHDAAMADLSVAALRDGDRAVGRNLLLFLTEFVDAEGSSLLTCDPATGRFQLQEIVGAKPGSFQVGDIDTFLQALRERRQMITRRALVNDKALAEMKTIGLQYAVQFHAEACLPSFLGEHLLAVVNFGPRKNNTLYDDALCQQLGRLASQCALLLQHAQLSAALRRADREMAGHAALRRQLLANMSHELRTPLSSIIGLTEQLMDTESVATPEERRAHLGMVHDSGQRLLRTVTALVDLAKLEAHGEGLAIGRIHLSRVLEALTPQLRPTAATQLLLRLDDGIPPIYGDETWVRCLLNHLLENAVKFTPQGRVWVDAERRGDMLKVGVHDTGIGIRPEKQEVIFSGFIQANGGPERSHEGSGIGLAISRRVVELHGGRLWLQSQPGMGSHFFFTLPLKPS
ncbi:MAG: HAMP domain-containing histidine kinase [Deltaproteobacteria bacterium]|nr:HAMP domain-containing histidine kinase [Deltaproteobacteria bacterium]